MTVVVRFQLIFLKKIKYISFRDLSPNRPFHATLVRVLGRVNDSEEVPKTVPIPPNIDTVNALFGTNLDTEEDMVASISF